jgi:hypothetical protein
MASEIDYSQIAKEHHKITKDISSSGAQLLNIERSFRTGDRFDWP